MIAFKTATLLTLLKDGETGIEFQVNHEHIFINITGEFIKDVAEFEPFDELRIRLFNFGAKCLGKC